MKLDLDAYSRHFSKRLAELMDRTYLDANGKQAAYLQDGHTAQLAAIYEIPDRLEMLKAAHSLLTTAEKRASINGRINRLPADQREAYIKVMPAAGSPHELEGLVALTIPLNFAIKCNSVQSQEAENAARIKSTISSVQRH